MKKSHANLLKGLSFRSPLSKEADATAMSPQKSLFMPTLKEQIVEMLKSCYDPEIPFNIVDLGLIYGLDVSSDGDIKIKMTLTSPGCPVGPWLTDEITSACRSVNGTRKVEIEIVFDPPWNREMMSQSAHESLGF